MYVTPNFKTKKELKDAVKAGRFVSVYNPVLGGHVEHGEVSVEGPHYPEPHRWYARVFVHDNRVTAVKS